MYATCLHCNAKLGANEVIEHFPVGRRLAFDGAKGRLWVVCPKCHRWNLTPLEERWEAIEECERQFRDTRLRASTDNIGLAKVREGLELVRIGKPQRPEMAAWRYAREFKRRWVTRGLPLAGGLVLFSGLNVVNTAEVFSPNVFFAGLAAAIVAGVLVARHVGSTRVVMPDGHVARVSVRHAGRFGLAPHDNTGWALTFGPADAPVVVGGASARRALRGGLTASNFRGGRDGQIRDAVALLQAVGGAEPYLNRLARAARNSGSPQIGTYPPDVRLALEMALHEQAERRALDGELASLEADWAVAEQVAAIADNMFLPAGVIERYGMLRREGAT
jgi:hypothetical protein